MLVDAGSADGCEEGVSLRGLMLVIAATIITGDSGQHPGGSEKRQ